MLCAITANAARCQGGSTSSRPRRGSYISLACYPSYAFSRAQAGAKNSLPELSSPSFWLGPAAAFTRRLDSSALQRFQRRRLITAVSCGDA